MLSYENTFRLFLWHYCYPATTRWSNLKMQNYISIESSEWASDRKRETWAAVLLRFFHSAHYRLFGTTRDLTNIFLFLLPLLLLVLLFCFRCNRDALIPLRSIDFAFSKGCFDEFMKIWWISVCCMSICSSTCKYVELLGQEWNSSARKLVNIAEKGT